jgi:DNA-binding CsgD family transcriptional regulator
MASQLISAQLTAATFDANLRPGVTDRLAPYLADALAGHPPQDPMICAHLGARMAISGDPAELVLPVIEGALALHPMVDESAHGVVLAFPLVSLLMIDEIERAEAALQRALSSSRARSSLITLTVAHHWWAVVAYRRGELVDAQAHDQRALAACGSDDWDLYGAWIGANLAHVWLERGDIEAAAAALGGDSDDAVDPIGGCLQLEARGRLALARGQAELAYEHFTNAGRKLDGMGMVSPGFVAWRSSAATAAHQMDHEQGANVLVEEELALARRTGSARAIGIALRAAALFATGDRQRTLLAESCETLRRSASRLERAKSLAEMGAALRRDGQRAAARQPLLEALDIATRSGAEPLATRIRTELSAAGSRPRRAALTGAEALTPTERRIAQLAAEHRTNAQIAHDLYVTSKTVEWHLGNIFRKLDVTSRTQLETVL